LAETVAARVRCSVWCGPKAVAARKSASPAAQQKSSPRRLLRAAVEQHCAVVHFDIADDLWKPELLLAAGPIPGSSTEHMGQRVFSGLCVSTSMGDTMEPDDASVHRAAKDVEGGSPSPIERAMALLQRVLEYQVSVAALIEVALWLAVPYLAIGFVWSFLHAEQVQQIQTRLEKVLPAGADVAAFGLTAALWPASIEIADACPSQ